MRYLLISLSMLLCPLMPAQAQVSVNIGLPGVEIGINMPAYPRLVRVPGYPVYYDPQVNSNYFFYDGLYWVYQPDNWYASSWYNGPWQLVERYDVPLYLLRVPVRYYRHPPAYFQGWRADAPPRWGEHWGNDWERRRSGWDQWDRKSVPAAAPLPTYQQRYSGDRYPRALEQQVMLRDQNYRYQPRETVTRQHYQAQGQRQQPQARQPAQQAQPRQEPSRQSVQQAQPRQEQPRQSAQQAQPRQEQPRQSVQQAQPRQEQPRQSAQQAQTPAHVQPKQPPAQAQHAPTAPQGRAPESRDARGKGQENRGKGQENKDAGHGKDQENKGKGQDKRSD